MWENEGNNNETIYIGLRSLYNKSLQQQKVSFFSCLEKIEQLVVQ